MRSKASWGKDLRPKVNDLTLPRRGPNISRARKLLWRGRLCLSPVLRQD